MAGPEILCVSPVTFGPVPLGRSASQQTLCVNEGTDVPGDSDAGLLITQGGLTLDNPAFAASLTLPDGGLAGSGFSVSLAPGQSEAIEITFEPGDAGSYSGRLVVQSNDLSDADAGITLSGEGIVPGPCSVELVPMQLSFGEVPGGDVGVLPFEIDNTGQNLCLVTGVSLDPKSDPAFSLPGGSLAYQLLSFPGDADNAAGLPTSLWVDVQFAPTTPASAATGTVDVTFSNAVPPEQSVSLVASSAAACLTLEPPDFDFGVLGFSPSNQQICLPDTKTFMALNSCTVPVTITAIDIASGVDATPQFALESVLQLPLTVAPAGTAYFQASFIPTDLGPKLGSITVSTSEFAGPFLVTLKGDAVRTGSRTDTFTVAPQDRQLDLLWVLDNDDDLSAVSAVTNMLPQLIGVLSDAGIDYQIAATSTDTCDGTTSNGANSDQGAIEPCDHCLSTASANPVFVTATTANPAATLSGLFSFFDIPPQVGACEQVIEDEHFFDALAAIFSPALLNGHNAGFMRSGADLAIVVVNHDTEDDSTVKTPTVASTSPPSKRSRRSSRASSPTPPWSRFPTLTSAGCSRSNRAWMRWCKQPEAWRSTAPCPAGKPCSSTSSRSSRATTIFV